MSWTPEGASHVTESRAEFSQHLLVNKGKGCEIFSFPFNLSLSPNSLLPTLQQAVLSGYWLQEPGLG